MEVKLIDYTKNAVDILIFSKRTRHMRSPDDFEKVKEMDVYAKEEELRYVFNTISGPLEFVDYTFLICDVTRAFTHQLVRHRAGVSFAQQSMRIGDQTDFKYLTPTSLEKNVGQFTAYEQAMEQINWLYKLLIQAGADQQDARGILPTNIYTNILMKINLSAFAGMLHTRLCVRAPGEFQDVAKLMMKEVLRVHPFTEPILGPHCVAKKICKFPRFDKCPVKVKYPWVDGALSQEVASLRDDWDAITIDQQPDTTEEAWKNG